jgi:hypothetical protein
MGSSELAVKGKIWDWADRSYQQMARRECLGCEQVRYEAAEVEVFGAFSMAALLEGSPWKMWARERQFPKIGSGFEGFRP